MRLRNKVKGFTLVELLLVMAIIGILAAVIFIMVGPARKKARITTFKQHMRDLANAGASCIDSDGTIHGGNADGSQVFCTDSSGNDVGMGNIPEIKNCQGGSATITIAVVNPQVDDFRITASCPVAAGVACHARCTLNGCEFSNDGTFATVDGCPATS